MKPVILVTGSGKRRVGSVVARHFAERGWNVALHYRTSATDAQAMSAELQSLGATVTTVAANLADEGEVRTMVTHVRREFGTIDAFVNCAAIWGRRRLEETTAADVRTQFETNTLGTFLCTQHVGLAMVQQPQGGAIVHLGDWAEARPYLDYAAYFVSKGAIPTLTRCMAHELGSRNPKVRVNAILPGPVMLPPDLPEVEKTQAIQATLVKREGRPENIAEAAWALVTNDFITGVCLPVDGGRTIYANDG